MAGHSKWANIKHRKERQDKKRGKLFSKLSKMITIAARESGGDPDKNPDLAMAVDKAKDANMPKDNIKRAIKKGIGELEGQEFVSDRLEAYGPGGVAVMIDIVTDNKNRTLSEVRKILNEHQGNLAEKGAVSWKFIKKGKMLLGIDKKEDKQGLLETIIEAGATDFEEVEGGILIFTQPNDLHQVKENLEKDKLKPKQAEFTYQPKTTISVEDKSKAKQITKLMNKLEDHDDVESTYADFDIDDELI